MALRDLLQERCNLYLALRDRPLNKEAANTFKTRGYLKCHDETKVLLLRYAMSLPDEFWNEFNSLKELDK